jgi:hypothetical protein
MVADNPTFAVAADPQPARVDLVRIREQRHLGLAFAVQTIRAAPPAKDTHASVSRTSTGIDGRVIKIGVAVEEPLL